MENCNSETAAQTGRLGPTSWEISLMGQIHLSTRRGPFPRNTEKCFWNGSEKSGRSHLLGEGCGEHRRFLAGCHGTAPTAVQHAQH